MRIAVTLFRSAKNNSPRNGRIVGVSPDPLGGPKWSGSGSAKGVTNAENARGHAHFGERWDWFRRHILKRGALPPWRPGDGAHAARSGRAPQGRRAYPGGVVDAGGTGEWFKAVESQDALEHLADKVAAFGAHRASRRERACVYRRRYDLPCGECDIAESGDERGAVAGACRRARSPEGDAGVPAAALKIRFACRR